MNIFHISTYRTKFSVIFSRSLRWITREQIKHVTQQLRCKLVVKMVCKDVRQWPKVILIPVL